MEEQLKNTTPKPSRKKVGKIFLLLRLTGIVMFIVIITRVDVREIWEYLLRTDLRLFSLGVLFQLGVLLLKAVRWHILNINPSGPGHWKQSFGEFFESYALGVITPGRLGEVLKAGYQKHRTGIVGSGIRVLVERGFDVGFFLLLAGCSIVWAQLVDLPLYWGWLIILAGSVAIITAILLLLSSRTLRLVSSIFLKARILKEHLQYRQSNIIETAVILLLSATGNISYFVSCYFLALGVGIEAGFLMIAGGVAIAGFINMLPVTVMGLGTREVTFLYVFNGFLRAQVLAFSGLVFLVAQVGGGVISLILGELFLFNKKRTAP